MGGDAPEVSEGILDEAGAVSVELVLNRLEELRAFCGCAFDNVVDVGEVDVEAYRAAADGGGAGVSRAHAGIFVGQHDVGVADFELGMTDLAVRAGHADGFRGTEDFLVVVDGLRRVPDDQVRRDGVVVLGNLRDFSCHDVLLKNVGWRWRFTACTRLAVWFGRL